MLVPAVRARLDVRSSSLWSALAVALTATVGSLVYSEVYHFEPCRLCWYQRIAMYPLVLLLGLALWKRDRGVVRYALPQAVIGALIATYHYTLETFPSLGDGACSRGVPCTARYVNEFGFVSISFMALSGFVFIIAVLISGRTKSE